MDQSLISGYIASDAVEELKDIVEDIALVITSGKATLVNLVEKLGPYLVKEEALLRTKATGCLTQVLESLPADQLNKQQTAVVCGFLCERLYDDESLEEVVHGLNAVISMKSFSASTSLKNILSSLRENVVMNKHTQNIRFEVLQFLKSLYYAHLDFIKVSLGVDFVDTYVALTNGEKDPRNLVLSFNLCTQMVKDLEDVFTLPETGKQHIDDVFDVTFCYFPITFEPPKNDPYGITSKDLKQALRRCLAANGEFAVYVVSGLIEKLSSNVQSIKEDVLLTLGECVDSYDAVKVKDYWREIWDGIKYEVLHGTDEVTSDNAGIVLMKLGKSLANLDQAQETALDDYLQSVKDECKGKLEESQSKLSVPAATLVADVSKSSVKAFKSLGEFSVDILLSSFSKSPSISKQKSILEILNMFLEAASDVDKEFDGQGQVVLQRFKDDILGVYAKCLMGSDSDEIALRMTALDGLTMLITNLVGYLSDNEIGLVGQYFDTIILEDPKEIICEAAVKAQLKISEHKPDMLTNTTFPALLALLPDSNNHGSQSAAISDKSTKSVSYLLSCLAKLTTSRTTFEILSIRLLNKLDAYLDQNEVSVTSSGSIQYPLEILTTLLDIITKFEKTPEKLHGYLFKFTPRLIQKVFSSKSREAAFRQNVFLSIIARITCLLIRTMTSEEDKAVAADELIKLFYTGEESKFLIDQSFTKEVEPMFSNEKCAPSPSACIFVMGIASMNKDNVHLKKIGEALFSNSIAIVSKSHETFERLSYLRLLSLLTNKWVTKEFVQSQLDPLYEEIENKSVQSLSALEVLTWISKGLVIKNDNLGYKILTEHVIKCLDRKDKLGKSAGKVLGVVAADDSVVCKENNLIIRLLYKQRLFVTISPLLVERFKNASDSAIKVNCMVGLAGLLRSTPGPIISGQLTSFLPLLLESLDLNDPNVLNATIDTVIVTLEDNSEVFRNHLNLMIPRLLKLANYKKSNVKRAEVRVRALQCLTGFPKTFDIKYLEPYRETIIKDLAEILDDPKRDVRHSSVVCRQEYYELAVIKDD